MNTGPPAIEVRSAWQVYGQGETRVVALRDASLSIAHGEVVALLGPSGSGKSTLLSIMGMIATPTSGDVLLDGRQIVRAGQAMGDLRRIRREHLGFVFQKANLIPFLTAMENVLVALDIADVPPAAARARARDLLAALGVADRAHHHPAKLSGGQQQRVAIARALANRPSLLLADEPTAALDGKLGRQVMELFRDLGHTHGAGVLVVTHDHRALDVFDRVVELEDGIITRDEPRRPVH
ncbi:MAG: ABC transporter ATP-binding protein [Leptolyngbya sp. PLA3]|nr:MAG: ABC transporter ATP-binding protein [Cyanobacteria bacterium CYA]MCE7968456.1 ABC transporter ATP-binding protein [Leptolyngbya sp. PL-A3]